MSGYNVVFTMLPPLLIGILDQDVDRAHISKFPGALPGRMPCLRVAAAGGPAAAAGLGCTRQLSVRARGSTHAQSSTRTKPYGRPALPALLDPAMEQVPGHVCLHP